MKININETDIKRIRGYDDKDRMVGYADPLSSAPAGIIFERWICETKTCHAKEPEVISLHAVVAWLRAKGATRFKVSSVAEWDGKE